MPASANRSSRQFSRNHPRSSPNTSGLISLTPGSSVSRISILSLPLKPSREMLSPDIPACAQSFASVGTVLYALPPLAIFQIPRHGGFQTGSQIHLRRPTQFAANPRCIDSVASVMTRAVPHVADQLPPRPLHRNLLVEKIAKRVNDLQIGSLGVAADIVGTSRHAIFDHAHQCPAVIGDEKPVAALLAVAVDRQLTALQRIDQHQRNELLRKLPRPVIVGTVRDYNRQSPGAVPCTDQMIGRRLACRIR